MLRCAIEHNLISFSVCEQYYTRAIFFCMVWYAIIYKSISAYVHLVYMDSNAKSFYLVCSCFKPDWFHALDFFCLLRGKKMDDVIWNYDVTENGTISCFVILGKWMEKESFDNDALITNHMVCLWDYSHSFTFKRFFYSWSGYNCSLDRVTRPSTQLFCAYLISFNQRISIFLFFTVSWIQFIQSHSVFCGRTGLAFETKRSSEQLLIRDRSWGHSTHSKRVSVCDNCGVLREHKET